MVIPVPARHSIALSKLDRGLDTDFDDIIFLIQNNFINLAELERVTQKALAQAREFDMNSTEVIAHSQELKKTALAFLQTFIHTRSQHMRFFNVHFGLSQVLRHRNPLQITFQKLPVSLLIGSA